MPAWDLIPVENYLSQKMHYLINDQRTLPLQSSRGCPYKCRFCSNEVMWGNLWSGRDSKKLVDEMEFYKKEYAVTNFVFNELTFAVTQKRIIDLCQELIKRELTVTWQVPDIRADILDFDTLALMREAGCTELHFAFETASEKVLDAVNKTNDCAKMLPLIKAGVASNINITVNIILGLPQDDFREFFKTYKFVLKAALAGLHEINVFPFMPYPGSKLFYKYVDEGKIKLNDAFFMEMQAYLNLTHAVSFSETFSPNVLRLMRIFLLSSFYFLMFLSHPLRIVEIIKNIFKGRNTTKIEVVIKRIINNNRLYFSKNKT